MKQLVLGTIFVFLGVFGVFPQTDEYRKNEFYVGYAGTRIDEGPFDEYVNGVQTSFVRNVHRFVGFKGDFSFVRRSERVPFEFVIDEDGDLVQRRRTLLGVNTFMGGVEIKDNKSESRVVPFSHVLVGAAHLRDRLRNRCEVENCGGVPSPGIGFSKIGFSTAFGGGIDVKATRHLTIRAIQADYNPIRFNGFTSHNFRIGIGIIIK